MEFFVYIEDINQHNVVKYNIFTHSNFSEAISKVCKQFIKDTEKLTNITNDSLKIFKEEIRSEIMYYFWSKAEWEIVLTSWVPFIEAEELEKLIKEREKSKKFRYSIEPSVALKVDVYDQIMLNFDLFFDYIFKNVNELSKKRVSK